MLLQGNNWVGFCSNDYPKNVFAVVVMAEIYVAVDVIDTKMKKHIINAIN